MMGFWPCGDERSSRGRGAVIWSTTDGAAHLRPVVAGCIVDSSSIMMPP